MDKDLKDLVKKLIKDELGEIVAEEIKKQFEPINKQIELIRKENRDSYDNISSQITEDRKDINKIKIDTAKGTEQNRVIIENQNHAEEKVVEAVKEEAKKIPAQTEKAVNKIFEQKPFLTKLLERFKKRG